MNGPRALAFARTDWTQRYKLRQIAAANQHSHHFVGLKRADNRFKLPRIADIRIVYAQDNIAALYARARGWPSTASTRSPCVNFNAPRCSAGISLTVKLKAFSYDDSGARLARADLEASSSIAIAKRCCFPLRQTVIVARAPGFICPTRRGKSVALSIAWPLKLRIISPACRPALSAGPPSSTLLTSAPCARGRPSEVATSCVTGPI